ncbi:hypothetical protein D3C72_2301110 [compost metagenome]
MEFIHVLIENLTFFKELGFIMIAIFEDTLVQCFIKFIPELTGMVIKIQMMIKVCTCKTH